jgi:hypothetical protein
MERRIYTVGLTSPDPSQALAHCPRMDATEPP